MREYWMYFPFFILHDWGKRSAEARSTHCAVLPKNRHPEIAWRALKGMRNRIVHNYGGVDMGIIYDTVRNDIPVTLNELEKMDI